MPVLVSALLLGGCATTPADRIAQNPTAFNVWPAAVQEKVRAGQVALGFTPEQVKMALGEPDRMYQHTTTAGSWDVWVYARERGRWSVGVGIGMGGGGGHTSVGAGAATTLQDSTARMGQALEVSFQGGVVTSIEQPRPRGRF